MNTHDHDNDALPGEDELTSLYRSLPRKEPPPALDRAVKQAAAHAVRTARRRPASRWPVAVATAAMVVVAAGLGWRMLQQPSSVPQMTTASVPAAAPAATPLPAPVAPATQRLATADEPVQALAGRPAEQATPSPRARQDNIRTAMKARVMAPAPPPPPPTVEAPAPALAASGETIAAAPPPAPAPPAPRVSAQAAPAPIAPSSYANAADASSAGSVAALSERDTRQATTLRAMATAAPMQPAPMPAPDATAANPADTPAQELAKIRQLFAWHRHDEAVQRLAAFQKAHPDVPVPDDLRAQLPDHE